MTTIPDSPCASRAPAQAGGFDGLDICDRQTVRALGKLAALITRLSIHGPDDAARPLAAKILLHFVATARQHTRSRSGTSFRGWSPAVTPNSYKTCSGCRRATTGWKRTGWKFHRTLAHGHMAMEESCIDLQALAQMGARLRYAMSRDMQEVSPSAETWRHTCHTPH